MRLQGQKQRALLLLAWPVARALYVHVNSPRPPRSQSSGTQGSLRMPAHQLAALNKGSTELGKSTTFRVGGDKPLCFLRGDVSFSFCANRALKNGLGKEWSDIKYIRMFSAQGGLLLPGYTFSWTALIWFEILNNLRNPCHIFKSTLSITSFSSIFKLLQIWSTLKTLSLYYALQSKYSLLFLIVKIIAICVLTFCLSFFVFHFFFNPAHFNLRSIYCCCC